jgi:hypothetical protein
MAFNLCTAEKAAEAAFLASLDERLQKFAIGKNQFHAVLGQELVRTKETNSSSRKIADINRFQGVILEEEGSRSAIKTAEFPAILK